MKADSSTDNRSVILVCALRLFSNRGYDSIGVQELALEAGITKPTLYYYFGSKRGILEALIQEGFAPFMDQLRQATTYSGDLPLTLQYIADTYFEFARKEAALYQMHLSLWFGIPDNEASQIVHTVVRDQQQLLETMFQKAEQDHGNMRNRHQIYSITFLGMINTYISHVYTHNLSFQTDMVRQLVHQFSHGIYS